MNVKHSEFGPEATGTDQQFLKTKSNLFQAWKLCAVALGIGRALSLAAAPQDSADTVPTKTSIPWSQIGAKAGADYQGDGLAVIPTAEGARLRCVFQQLEGEATRDGLWLTSTLTDGVSDRFRIVAVAVGRPAERQVVPARQAGRGEGPLGEHIEWLAVTARPPYLPSQGTIQVAGNRVRFTRPRLVEEYCVSMDGVRQDFAVLERPEGAGELAVRLAVRGAKVEPAVGGAQLVLEDSGRKIGYSRLRVTDDTGRELVAQMEVVGYGKSQRDSIVQPSQEDAVTSSLNEVGADVGAMTISETSAPALVVVVNDADAVYPVRIDPTLSDANWISVGGLTGASGTIYATIVDNNGSLYVGGDFTSIGTVSANSIAKWNGRVWSALGAGVSNPVYALALDTNSNLYAGGNFVFAGGVSVDGIAKWDGSAWSALGSGMDAYVDALIFDTNGNLYAGGNFLTAGGVTVSGIAKWNGNTWSALGSGMDAYVAALAFDANGNLYAGGNFLTAGGLTVSGIAKWDGSAWSGLGSGMDAYVDALTFDTNGSLYAGGNFLTAGGVTVSGIAKWDGNAWSALGSGMDAYVAALAFDTSGKLYAAGDFFTAGGVRVNGIASWNGSAWSALGTGMNNVVHSLAFDPSGNLYVSGSFTTAGTNASAYLAEALLAKSSYNLSLTRLDAGTDVITGLGTPNYTYALDLATNLTSPVNWMPVATNTVSGRNLIFTNLSTSPQGFYRMRFVP